MGGRGNDRSGKSARPRVGWQADVTTAAAAGAGASGDSEFDDD